MLKRVYVDNFRSLTGFEMHVPPLAVIMGGNGSGKTSVWEVLVGIQQLVGRAQLASAVFPTETLCLWDAARNTQRLELDVRGPRGDYRYTLALAHDRERRHVRIVEEAVVLDGSTLFRCADGTVSLLGDAPSQQAVAKFEVDRHRSFLSLIEPNRVGTALAWLVDWIRRLCVVQPNPIAMTSISDDATDTLEIDASNFASWYRTIVERHPEAAADGCRELGKILGGFRTLDFEKAGESRILKARFAKADGGEHDVPFDHLSHGERTAMLLYVMVHASSASSLLFLDEPENYLALPEIQPWLARLRQQTDDTGAQALIISHHPEIIDYLAATDALLFHRKDGGPTRVRALDVDREAGLTASQWWARGLADAEP